MARLRRVGVEDPFLALEDIQCCPAEPAGLQRGDERRGIQQRAASGVDDERAALQLRDASTIEQMKRVGGQRGVQRDNVASPQQFIEWHVTGRDLRPGVVGQHAAAEARRASPGPLRRYARSR